MVALPIAPTTTTTATITNSIYYVSPLDDTGGPAPPTSLADSTHSLTFPSNPLHLSLILLPITSLARLISSPPCSLIFLLNPLLYPPPHLHPFHFTCSFHPTCPFNSLSRSLSVVGKGSQLQRITKWLLQRPTCSQTTERFFLILISENA